MSIEQSVQTHYSVENLRQAIFGALQKAGKDPNDIKPADLAPVDEFHIRGRESTEELAGLVDLPHDSRVLDIGSGIGGTARYLATTHGCHVTGIDLTQSYCDVANELSAHIGLTDRTKFEQANALQLPFHDQTFDVVWTEHAQMNIENKAQFYSEAVRALKPGGRLVFHDIFAGKGGVPHFPVPWASTADLSYLAPSEEIRGVLEALDMTALHWIDSTERSQAWFEAALERNKKNGPPPVGLHLHMGPTGKQKFMNVLQSLIEDRVTTVQAVLVKNG